MKDDDWYFLRFMVLLAGWTYFSPIFMYATITFANYGQRPTMHHLILDSFLLSGIMLGVYGMCAYKISRIKKKKSSRQMEV